MLESWHDLPSVDTTTGAGAGAVTVGTDRSRRGFLLGSAVAASAATLSASSPAALGLVQQADAGVVVLHDRRIALPADIASRLAANGARLVALEGDVVRLWRGELAAVLGDPATRLLGVTRWPELLIVRGLAAESRRHLRHEQFDPGSASFIWLIA